MNDLKFTTAGDFMIEFEYDKRAEDNRLMMQLLEQRIGDQLFDPEPQYDGMLSKLSKPTMATLHYELQRALDEYAKSLVKEDPPEYVYPGSDPQE